MTDLSKNHRGPKDRDNRDKSLHGLMVALGIAGAIAGSAVLFAYASSDELAAATSGVQAEPQVVEKLIQKPVYIERIKYVNQTVEVEKPVYINRTIEVEKPVYIEKTVEVEKEVPVYIEKEVPVYIEKPVYIYVDETEEENDDDGKDRKKHDKERNDDDSKVELKDIVNKAQDLVDDEDDRKEDHD